MYTHAVAGVKREAQRRRTRQAIVGAAAELLAEGRTPSISEIAEAADVSRRTVYMYFPRSSTCSRTRRSRPRGSRWSPSRAADDVAERLEALVRAMQSSALATEELGRIIIRHTIEAREADEATRLRGAATAAWTGSSGRSSPRARNSARRRFERARVGADAR